MKKFLITLMLVLSLGLVGCDLGGDQTTTVEQNELALALQNMEEVTNVTMVMTMTDVPLFGTLETTMKLTEELAYVEVLGQEEYMRVDGVDFYLYAIEDGEWVSASEPMEDEGGSNEFVDTDMFDPNNFEEVDGVWVLTVEDIELEDAEYLVNVELTLDSEGRLILMEYDIVSDEITMGVSIVLSDYGTTVVELPEIQE